MSISYRHAKILEIINEQQSVRISQLTEFFGVSNVTIRKDLDDLHNQGLLIKTHGGAVSKTADFSDTDPDTDRRTQRLKSVAELAFSSIQDGDCVFLGSGYTCLLLAEKLQQLNNVTVVTNNLSAISLLDSSNINTFILGGEPIFNNNMVSTSCYKADEFFQGKITINKAYTSIVGIDLKAGLTVNYEQSFKMYLTIRKIISNWVLMADSSKFNKTSLYKVADISDVKCVVSDSIPNDYQQYLANNNIDYRTL